MSTPTLIKGGQEIAWIDKKKNQLHTLRVCSYSEYYEENECKPCPEGTFSTLENIFICRSCDKVRKNDKYDDLRVICKSKDAFSEPFKTSFDLVDVDFGSD